MTDAVIRAARTNTKYMIEETQIEGFIGKAEVARRLGKTTRTVDAWMKSGILPYYKPSRCVLFRWSDIEEQIVRNHRARRPGNALQHKPSSTNLAA